VFRYPDALARAVRRFGATAIVLNRSAPTCGKLPAGWVPAVVEPFYSTWVRAGAGAELTALAPCGKSFLRENACIGGAEALDREIRDLGRSDFAGYLRAERILRCGGPLDEVPRALPARALSREYLAQRDAAEAAWLIRVGDVR